MLVSNGAVVNDAAAQAESSTQAKQQYQADTRDDGAVMDVRTSTEYRALAYQGYNVALNIVNMAVVDPSHQRKPLAIVLDADENSNR